MGSCCNALCSFVCAMCVFLCSCRILCARECVKCVCVCVSWVYFCTFVQDEWWGFPVYIPQFNMPVIAVRAECPAGSILKTLCLFHMEQLRPATWSLFHLTALSRLLFFTTAARTAATDSFHVGICSRDVLRGCAHACVCRWCIRVHWRSLNSSFWSAQEPCRILVRYSWKMKYITSIPEAQIPDGMKWLEGDSAIFSSQQSPSSAKWNRLLQVPQQNKWET